MLVLRCLALIGGVVVTLVLLWYMDAATSANGADGSSVEGPRSAIGALVRWVVGCVKPAESEVSGVMDSAGTAGMRGGENDE